MSDPQRAPESDHLLLTVLGTNPSPALYALGEQRAEARLAPLALLEMLPEAERPDHVLAICTREAKEDAWPLLVDGLSGRCTFDTVEVPSGEAQEHIPEFLDRVVAKIPTGPALELTVDVTHGFRHFSFLTYLAVLYLAALRGVRVRGAYYGLLRRGQECPFLDLRPLLELPRWLHALQVLRDTGSAIPMGRILGEGSGGPLATRIASELSQISEGYLSGLPLELGRQARQFNQERLKPLRKLLARNHRLPLAAELVAGLGQVLAPFALEHGTGDGWKGQVPLSKTELERQALMLDDLLRREHTASALGLMNEWTVSWVAWRLGRERGWLDFNKVRRKAARLLGALDAVQADPDLQHLLTEDRRRLGRYWHDLCELRNAFHHHGMRPQVLVGNQQVARRLETVRQYWQETLRGCPEFRLDLGSSGAGRILVSPIGHRPGVLFSALRACGDGEDEPVSCLVLCSEETAGSIAEACNRAGYSGDVVELRLEDAYGGRGEIDLLVKAARPHLVGAEEVLVNVTGGTTLMGLAAEALAGTARSLARPVRRFGLIDRRTPEQQSAEPFRTGEPFWLDAAEVDDGHDG